LTVTITPCPLPADIDLALTRYAGRLGIFAGRIQYWALVASTNDIAARLADQGAADGTVVLAETQTAGRGRHGRSWHSPPGAGLYVSLVLPADGGTHVTLMAGVAVAEAIRTITGLPVEIKWPNDVVSVAGGPARWRKVAGILAESTRVGAAAERLVLGVGINVRPADRPPELAMRATSLEEEVSRPVDRALLLVECLAGIASWQTRLRLADGRAALLTRWRELSPSSCGAVVTWHTHDRRQGVTEGIDEDGALRVRTARGVERLVGGGVIWG
jgi:BirA family biotin operon repressor/biotin-[acetyl-CoA-carboxylase] ligase